MIPRAEHVYVLDHGGLGDSQRTGLLVGWEQRDDGTWWAWVITAQVGAQDSGPYINQAWVPAEWVTRRDGSDPPATVMP